MNGKHPPWFDNETIKLLKEKKRLYNKFRRTKSQADENLYKFKRNAFKEKHRLQHRLYLDDLQKNIQSSPKAFWNFVNSKRKDKSIPVNVQLHSIKSENPQEAADLFAEFFEGVYRNSVPVTVPQYASRNDNMPNLEITTEIIHQKILSLDMSKGAGPDGIPNTFLRNCEIGLLQPLYLLFNASLRNGDFPNLWKISHIVPIHKSGSKLSVDNYRGVAILSAIPKMFESIFYDHAYAWIEPQISNCQHGFLKKRSTVTNLAEFVSRTVQWMADGYQVDTVYTDMSKAFDVVDINSLISVLIKYGFDSLTLKWIHSYLTKRLQYVKLQSACSKLIATSSGVPQGSHLGPLLFIIVMNELPTLLIDVFILIYADDVKIFIPVRSIKDCTTLQHNLDRFLEFCNIFGLRVNVSKCNVVSFGRKINKIMYDYRIGANVVQRKQCHCDLGVELDSELTFTKHVEKIVSKANSLFGMVKRFGRELDDPYTIIAIYSGLVRTSIEYASVVWQPYYIVHSNRIERVQKKFVRYALRNLGWRDDMPDYRALCMLVGINSLQDRRTLADALFLKDLVSGKYKSPYLCNQVTRYEGRANLRRTRTFQLSNRVQNYARNEPLYRMMAIYNDLQQHITIEMPRDKLIDNLRQYFIDCM